MSASVASAGLVPSKTSQGHGSLIGFAASAGARALGRIRRLKRSVWASGHLHGIANRGFRPPVCWFVTLTYRRIDEWEANHISDAIERYRQWCRRFKVPCRYTWVGELQTRGAVHYHLLAWLPQGLRMPHWDRQPDRRRRAFWQHGMSNTEVAYSGIGYLMKYLSKLGEFHRFPKGLRLYGIGGLDDQGRAVRSWFNLPEWAKRLHGVGELKRSKAGLVVQDTGEVLDSPYRVDRVPGGLLLRLVGELAPRFHDGAYSRLEFA